MRKYAQNVRSELEMNRFPTYIANNPAMWAKDTFFEPDQRADTQVGPYQSPARITQTSVESFVLGTELAAGSGNLHAARVAHGGRDAG